MNEFFNHIMIQLHDKEIQVILFLIIYTMLCIGKVAIMQDAKPYYFCYCFNSKNNVVCKECVSRKQFCNYYKYNDYPVLHMTNTSIYFLCDEKMKRN